VVPCHTVVVRSKVTITLSREVAGRLRQKAAAENTTVSRLVGRILEDQMRLSDEYWRAYERWKKIAGIPEVDATARLSREDAHERRPV
jgi:hypothetical protein